MSWQSMSPVLAKRTQRSMRYGTRPTRTGRARNRRSPSTALANAKLLCKLPSTLQHRLDVDGGSRFPLALVRSLHEGVDLECLFRRDGRRAGFKELNDLGNQRLISFKTAAGQHCLAA